MTLLRVAYACAEIVMGVAIVTNAAARVPINLGARLCSVAFIVRLQSKPFSS
jgi:hypothetical protein